VVVQPAPSRRETARTAADVAGPADPRVRQGTDDLDRIRRRFLVSARRPCRTGLERCEHLRARRFAAISVRSTLMLFDPVRIAARQRWRASMGSTSAVRMPKRYFSQKQRRNGCPGVVTAQSSPLIPRCCCCVRTPAGLAGSRPVIAKHGMSNFAGRRSAGSVRSPEGRRRVGSSAFTSARIPPGT